MAPIARATADGHDSRRARDDAGPEEARAASRGSARRGARSRARRPTRCSSRSRRRASAAPTSTSSAGTSGRSSGSTRRSRSGTSSPARSSRSARTSATSQVGRLRLGGEPHHLRDVLPLPHRPGAHVRADADPRRRPRRRVRARTSPCPEAVIWQNDRAKLPPEIATLQEPFGNAVFATSEQDLAGRSVAVLGCGPIGLFTIGIARASGAAVVLASDRTPFRLGLAEEMGAHATVERRRDRRTRRLVPRAERGLRLRRRLRDVRLAARDRRRLPDRPQRRARDPLRHPVAARRDRRRRGADLQEPRRAGAQRPPDLRHLVQDPLAAGERRRRPAAADHRTRCALERVRARRSSSSTRARRARSSSTRTGSPRDAARRGRASRSREPAPRSIGHAPVGPR